MFTIRLISVRRIPASAWTASAIEVIHHIRTYAFLLARAPDTGRPHDARDYFQVLHTIADDQLSPNEDGTYSCLGRFGDMLKAVGSGFSPSGVEERLCQHPAVAVAVAAPEGDGLEKRVACVVAAAGRKVDPGELIEFCREGFAECKCPRGIVEVAELPKTATGKIRRNVIRELVHDALLVKS